MRRKAIRPAALRASFAARQTPGLAKKPAQRVPEPNPASPPLTRAESIRRLCALYGQEKHAEYLIASSADLQQVAATLALLCG